jgi:hypothetical protein
VRSPCPGAFVFTRLQDGITQVPRLRIGKQEKSF